MRFWRPADKRQRPSSPSPPRRRVGLAARALSCALTASLGVAPAAGAATLTGRVVGLTPTTLTVQTSGPRRGLVDALIAGGDAITRADLPYVWGGGHAAAGSPSLGSPGPGFTGHTVGYDCSGAVAAVLVHAGLWPRGTAVPPDYGVIDSLRARGLIVPGVGRGADQVTFYDFPDVHIFLSVDGNFFGTADGGAGGDPAGGPGWLYDAALFAPNFALWDAANTAFHPYHLRLALLRSSAGAAKRYSFVLFGARAALAAGLEVGEPVTVSYREAGTGALVPSRVAVAGATTTTGTVVSTGPDALTVQPAAGAPVSFSAGSQPALVAGLQPGDGVSVSSVPVHGTPVAVAVTVTSAVGAG